MTTVRHVPRELLDKYATSAPRYTSYPTAVDWTDEFDPKDYPQLLASASRRDDPISVYVHLPFCEHMCLFCGCNVTITRREDRVEAYLDALEKEFETVARSGIGRRAVHQYHWGGGTPTHLTLTQIERVQTIFDRVFHFAPEAEVSIEVDPRVTTPEQIELLASLGFNRISMGQQDFDEKVQEHVHRVQPEEATRAIVQKSRDCGMASVNIDLMYGLPFQTQGSFESSVDTVIDMRPERVALFHYAHVPWLKKHQTALDQDAMPSSDEKLTIFLRAIEQFENAGYVYIGLDHFALPDDPLAVAQGQGVLHRNFMGYTTHRGSEMVSLGVSSIGEVDGAFIQNELAEPDYKQRIESDGFAAKRGHRLSPDDHLRRDVILSLMCNGVIDKAAIEGRHGISFDQTFADALRALEPLAADDLIVCAEREVRLTPMGQMFMRNAALIFDPYYAARQADGRDSSNTFSRTL